MTLLHLDTATLVALGSGALGCALLAQSHVQTRMLRARLAAGSGTVAMDPATGLFSAAATMQCLRAEVNRAQRMGHDLDVHVGRAADAAALDSAGRQVAEHIPLGAVGLRLGRTAIAVLACEQLDATRAIEHVDGVTWAVRRIEPDDHAQLAALSFIAEATRAA